MVCKLALQEKRKEILQAEVIPVGNLYPREAHCKQQIGGKCETLCFKTLYKENILKQKKKIIYGAGFKVCRTKISLNITGKGWKGTLKATLVRFAVRMAAVENIRDNKCW